MTATTRSPGCNPRWARSPWTTSCSTPRSRRWRANALWPTGGRDDEQGTLALLCLLLWSGARCTRVEGLARQRLSLSQRDAAEHERPSPPPPRAGGGGGGGGGRGKIFFPPANRCLPPSRRGLPQVMGAIALC